MVNFFDDISDQVDVYNTLFLDVLNEHAPIKRIKIKAKPNPFVTPEILQLLKTRHNWYKSAIKAIIIHLKYFPDSDWLKAPA